jgi:transposase
MEADADNLLPWQRAGHEACARRIAQLESQVADLQARLARIEQLLAERDRGAKRQAAPFSKGPPCAAPKTPGRKPGDDYGTKAFRAVPAPGQIDEFHEAPLPDRCPRCGAVGLVATAQHYQYQAELPRRPIYRQFNVAVGQCTCCGKKVQGRHPLQTSDALGCCASQLGPDAQTLAVILNKRMGLSLGKTADIFRKFFQLSVTSGGVCQALLRAARRTEPQRNEIVQQLPTSPWIVPDETGWHVGGKMAWLHTAVGINATAYLVHTQRGYEAALELIPANYTGTLVHDGWAPYDRFTQAGHQTCLAHLLRRCAALLEICEGVKGAAAVVPQKIKALLQEALRVRDQRDAGAITAQAAATAGVKLQQRMARLTGTPKSHAGNERLCKHIWKHQDQLFTFLAQPGLDATNYRAEQAIRPAVVNRKVWGGNRTEHGAWAQGVLLTVLETLSRRGADVAQWLSQALREWPRITPLPVMVGSG